LTKKTKNALCRICNFLPLLFQLGLAEQEWSAFDGAKSAPSLSLDGTAGRGVGLPHLMNPSALAGARLLPCRRRILSLSSLSPHSLPSCTLSLPAHRTLSPKQAMAAEVRVVSLCRRRCGRGRETVRGPLPLLARAPPRGPRARQRHPVGRQEERRPTRCTASR